MSVSNLCVADTAHMVAGAFDGIAGAVCAELRAVDSQKPDSREKVLNISYLVESSGLLGSEYSVPHWKTLLTRENTELRSTRRRPHLLAALLRRDALTLAGFDLCDKWVGW